MGFVRMEELRRELAVRLEKMRSQNRVGFCVMTEGQVEELQKQIAVYAIICTQLVDMHKTFLAQQDIARMKIGNVFGDSMSFGGNKVSPRQRWTPSSMKLEVLERIYNEAKGNPGKNIVKEITKELAQHGQVTETNVYNWFQNRRARSKRKVPTGTIKDKKKKPEDMYV